MRNPASDSASAEWLAERLERPGATLGVSVGEVAPRGFTAYARIFHRARSPYEYHQSVRWSEVAASTGRIAHPLMEWHRITTPVPGGGMRAWDREHGEPVEGQPSEDELSELIDVLRLHTETPDRCWFCSWTGFGGTKETGAVVGLPGREYFLSVGPIDEATGFERPPNIWWPDDRAWCVTSEIDLLTTYVGGSAKALGDLLNSSVLEAFEVSADDRVDSDADLVNSD